jgi:5-formyltetrahydrofolate cyclo-ligase
MIDPALERPRLRARRRGIGPTAAATGATAVRHALLTELSAERALGPGLRVGTYFAHDGELDVEPLAVALRELGASTWYPLVPDRPDDPLRFRRWNGLAPLERGPYGISVPATGDVMDGTRLSVVIVPLVGFDSHRNRLGMGAGHYDRTFAVERFGSRVRPFLIGVAYDEQEVERLTPRPWDVPLDLVVTPTRVVR